MCLLHLHLQLAQILGLPLACAVAMATRTVGMGSWVGHLRTRGSEPPEHRGASERRRDAGQAPAAGTWAPRSRELGKWSPSAHLGRGCVPPPRAASQRPYEPSGTRLGQPCWRGRLSPCRGCCPAPYSWICPFSRPRAQALPRRAGVVVPGRLALPRPVPSSLPGLQKVVWELAGRSPRLQLWRWRLPWVSAGSAPCAWGFCGQGHNPGGF